MHSGLQASIVSLGARRARSAYFVSESQERRRPSNEPRVLPHVRLGEASRWQIENWTTEKEASHVLNCRDDCVL